MTQWTLKQITETSYILEKDGTNLGMMIIKPQEYRLIGAFERRSFEDFDDLQTWLGGSLTAEARDQDDDKEDEIGQINGYPIKHKSAFDIEQGSIVTYAKTAKGKARFAAGYFALNFDHGWTGSYCPRAQTLAENCYIGPFRTKLEMQNAMSQKKRTAKI